ncbi:probable serine hydrolase [Zootermopsis nevadensis]|uniref:Putative serine hydrolase n=1 Tax=Zootermopsis nevadensis TaxID=136037 RepID=A0A067QTY7_ZOONE|nr:probable serine hydrolase [Zootermopsis nevadensis]XP_021932900.1 probable serine hydrolase [Zootermopsis nevadensis]XP_021932901.1 probable serine hydrolase [Zootermopsis nevadensis]XP_021932902.1 probable serine hydrolase [Zootermopsis nevadensis]KDR12428.1 putative serine hydrolase [Zootermopsis nevadensis]
MANEPEEIKIPVPWGYISGKWWGPQDKQPVLAIHGWQDNAGSFDRLAPLLPAHIAILCIDLPGHGLSSPYPKGCFYYLHWDGLSVVRRIVKYFKWEKITILGHSLGGAIGFLYAASYPDDTDKLICIDVASPAFADVSEMVDMTRRGIDKFLKYENYTKKDEPCYGYEEMLNVMLLGHDGSLTLASGEILVKRGSYKDPVTNNYLFTRDVRLLSLIPCISLEVASEYARNITCKVLNIKAKPGSRYRCNDLYHAILDEIKETARHFEFFEVEGTHHLHLNNPEDISSYVINFLES